MIRDFLEKTEFNLHIENSTHPDFNLLLFLFRLLPQNCAVHYSQRPK